MSLGILYANTSKNVFAINGKLPWKCRADMNYFKNITLGSSIVMGRKTADSLKCSLPGRKNYVISRSTYTREGFLNISIEDTINLSKKEKVWVIGGKEIIDKFIKEYINDITIISHSVISEAYLNIVPRDNDLVPDVLTYKHSTDILDIFKHESFNIYKGVNVFIYYRNDINNSISKLDKDYLDIGKKIVQERVRAGRNGEIRSSFDPNTYITASFKDGFPILNSKQVWWKGIYEELNFFLSGETDTLKLEKTGVKIWTGNTSEEFLKENNKTNLKPGEMGPMYGYQWRHFGAPYEGASPEKEAEGVDQIKNVIKLISEDPNSRRILMTTYNPAQSEEGVLYPCHGLITQFYVTNDGKISLKTYQRSADWFLGVPFNISSYALLLDYIIKEVNAVGNSDDGSVKYSTGEVTIYFGDTHLYECHIPVFVAQYVNSLITDFSTKDKVELSSDTSMLINYTPERKFLGKMVC